MKFIVLVLTIAVSSFAHGAGINEAPQENYRNPKDEKGLCTSRNEEEWPYRRGYCKAIKEQLTLPGCASDAVKDLCQRMAKPEPGKTVDKPISSFGVLDNCSANNGKTGFDEIAKNPQDCAYILTQFFAILAIETSDWNDAANKDAGEDEGLLGLKKSDMTDSRYECGCNTAVHKEIPVDRPADGHQNLVCGMYMGIYWAQKDGIISNFGKPEPGKALVPAAAQPGQPAPKDDNGPKGMSRIFKVLQGHKDGDKAAEARDDRIAKKMMNFCKGYKPGAQGKTSGIDEDMDVDSFQKSMDELKKNNPGGAK